MFSSFSIGAEASTEITVFDYSFPPSSYVDLALLIRLPPAQIMSSGQEPRHPTQDELRLKLRGFGERLQAEHERTTSPQPPRSRYVRFIRWN